MTGRENGAPSRRRGLVIVDHGSRNAESNARTASFAARVREARPEWLVVHAHMEMAEPDFAASIDALVEGGATEIFVHIHFLGTGYHVRESIPELVETARARHTSIPIRASEPLGDDPRLVEIVLDRMDDHD